jgi:late embryogenesis abundant protein
MEAVGVWLNPRNDRCMRWKKTRQLRFLGKALVAIVLVVCSTSCATLEGLRALVQAPKFEEAEGQPAEIRILGPGTNRPLGGAAVRIWTKVTNPNPFGITLGTLAGTLLLEGTRAATAEFPLGLPLTAGQENVLPIDLSISFSDLPALADTLRRAARNQTVPYSLDGTIGVDAGRLGQPVFGPMTLVRGDLRIR